MAQRTSKKSAKVAKKAAAKRVATKAAKPRKAVAKSSAPKPTKAAVVAKDGPRTIHHKDGSIYGKGQMLDGKMHGYWEFYRKDGTIMRSGSFDREEQIGTWTTYDATGKPVKVTEMKAAAKAKPEAKAAKPHNAVAKSSDRNGDVIAWLKSAREPWVVYNTLVELEGCKPGSREARAAHDAMVKHPQIRTLIDALNTWPPDDPLSRAYDPKDSIWKLNTLADFGLRRDDKRIAAIADRVLAAQAPSGGFLHGGFDHTKSWHARPYICISHVMTYALAQFGYLRDACVRSAYEHIAQWQRNDGGWHPNEKNLPGNEGEDEPSCPFGTLNVLRAVVADPQQRGGKIARRAAGFLLECWARRDEPYRPVKFGIGSTWNKLQYPFVQYQMLKMIDALSLIPSAHSDARFKQMLDALQAKRTPNGTWIPEGVNKPFAEFDFGQKKEPSAWVTFLALRALNRCGRR